MCSNPALSNKKEYPTFARTYSDWTPALMKILQTFNWKNVALIYTENNKFEAAVKHLRQEFGKSDNRINVSCELPVREQINVLRTGGMKWANETYGGFMRTLKGGSKY